MHHLPAFRIALGIALGCAIAAPILAQSSSKDRTNGDPATIGHPLRFGRASVPEFRRRADIPATGLPLSVQVMDSANHASIPVKVTTSMQGAGAFQVDVDLNHDGEFSGRGELGYVRGSFSGARDNEITAHLHGLVEGSYQLRARMKWGGREFTSPVQEFWVKSPRNHRLTISFERNVGQAHGKVLFVGHARNQTVHILPAEAVLVTSRPPTKSEPAPKPQVQRFRMIGGNPSALPAGRTKLDAAANYFIGNDPLGWRTKIDTYQEVVTKDLYPGIDLVYHSTRQGELEYDFRVAAGANPSLITIEFPDAETLSINGDGGLDMRTGDGLTLCKSAPILYQERDGHREAVKGDWFLKGARRAGYVIADYDRTRELVIDPVVFSTFIGGNNGDEAYAVTTDAAGNIYLTGRANSANYPLQTPFDGTWNNTEIFVTKMNATGSALLFSTFLGGTNWEVSVSGTNSNGIVVDPAGNVYVTCATGSNDFPVVLPAQATFGGNAEDAIVTKFNPTGSALLFSTYLGGTGNDEGLGIALDASGNVYVGGAVSGSGSFPTTPGAYKVSPAVLADGFVVKYSPTGSVIYSTLIGGPGGDVVRAIAVLGTNAYVTGQTDGGFPTTPGAYQMAYAGGPFDTFVLQLNASGTGAVYSTLLGGNQGDIGYGIAVDPAGNSYVGVRTNSANFPTTPGVVQPTPGGGSDGAVAKLNPAGTALVYSTFVGGTGVDNINGLTIDSGGRAYLVGQTGSTNFPQVNGNQPFGGGASDAFVSVLDPAGSSFVLSTYLGGALRDEGWAITLDNSLNIIVVGLTDSTNFPTLNPFQPAYGGGVWDSFVTKLSSIAPPPPPPPPPPAGGTATGTNEGNYPESFRPSGGGEGTFGFGGTPPASPSILAGPTLSGEFHVVRNVSYQPRPAAETFGALSAAWTALAGVGLAALALLAAWYRSFGA